MIRAACLHAEAKGSIGAEMALGQIFNEWMEANGNPEVVKFFEPIRLAKTYGDHNYNEYHVTMTFFYRVPCGLRELED